MPRIPQFTLGQLFAVITAICVALVAAIGGFGKAVQAITLVMSGVAAIALLQMFFEGIVEFVLCVALPWAAWTATAPFRWLRSQFRSERASLPVTEPKALPPTRRILPH